MLRCLPAAPDAEERTRSLCVHVERRLMERARGGDARREPAVSACQDLARDVVVDEGW